MKDGCTQEAKRESAIILHEQDVTSIQLSSFSDLSLNYACQAYGNFNSLFGLANSPRVKTIMRLFDSK